jgi:N-acetyl-anhydromuramoyl-L-alanine amidase
LRSRIAKPGAALTVDAAGLVSGARFIASPNYDERPDDASVDLLVIHNISLPPGEYGGPGVAALFTNSLNAADHPYYQTIRDLKVSSHFFIRRDGELIQFVSCLKRAWHAGLSSWRGRDRCNDFSIGIELEGTDDLPFSDEQYGTLARLISCLTTTYPIQDVVGHSDISPGRKSDPGPCFDWLRCRKFYSNISDS